MQQLEHLPPLRTRWAPGRRRVVGIAALAALLASVPLVASSGAAAATTVSIAQFPAQGPCTFTDTFGAVRPDGANHQGVDIIATIGRKVYAVNDGTLTQQLVVAPNQLFGNAWRLTRVDGTFFLYAHLSAFATGLKVGSKVKAGQIIGAVGDTGNAGTPHLHFEVHPGGGAAVDPYPIVSRVNGCNTSVVPPQPTTTTTTVPSPPTIDKWTFVAPLKALDTTGGARLAAGSTTAVKVNALAGVPSNAPGVMVRMIARNATTRGTLTLHACGTTSHAGTLAMVPGQLAATTTLVKVSAGSICVTTTSAIDLRLDVMAYLGGSGAGLRAVPATRALDTRRGAPLAAGATIAATRTALGMGSTDRGVLVTVTLSSPAAAGSFGIGACGGVPWIVPYPKVSLQVFSAVVPAGASDVCMSSTQTVHVVVDVNGIWGGTGGVVPSGPVRQFDSRATSAVTTATRTVPLALPVGTRRALLTFTLVGGTTIGVLYAWPCSLPKPVASVGAVRIGAWATVAVAFDATRGGLCIASNGSVHVVVDAAATG